MLGQLKQLVKLQEIDYDIQEKTQTKDQSAHKLETINVTLKEEIKKKEEYQQIFFKAEKEHREKESQLKIEEQKITQIENKILGVKNEKEYEAVYKELETAKEKKSILEEEILKLLDIISEASQNLKKCQENIIYLTTEYEKNKDLLEEQIRSLDNDISLLSIKRTEIAQQVNTSLLKKYDMIRTRRMGIGIVHIVDATCQGCFMNIPWQEYSLVLKDKVVQCQNCNRLLYIKEHLEDSYILEKEDASK